MENDALGPEGPTKRPRFWVTIGRASAVTALTYYSLGIADHAVPWVRVLVAWAASIMT